MDPEEPQTQRNRAMAEESSRISSTTIDSAMSWAQRYRASTEKSSGNYEHPRPSRRGNAVRPFQYNTASVNQPFWHDTLHNTYQNQLRFQRYRSVEQYNHLQRQMHHQNTDPRDYLRENTQPQSGSQKSQSYPCSQQGARSQRGGHTKPYQTSEQLHQSEQGGQRSNQGGQHSQPYDYYQPNMHTMQYQHSQQSHSARNRNYSQQSQHSEPYHHSHHGQHAPSYQQCQPNQNLERYPYTQEQQKQHHQQYQQLHNGQADPFILEKQHAIQVKIDELHQKDAALHAQKSNLLVSRLMEQQQAFERGSTYLLEFGRMMINNKLKQKGITQEMYAEAYQKELQNMQRESSHRGGFGRGGGRGGGRGSAPHN